MKNILKAFAIFSLAACASCVSAANAIKPVSDEWKQITDAGIKGVDQPTADKLNHFSGTLSNAVVAANTPAIGAAPLVGPSFGRPAPSAGAVETGVNMAADFASGNWLGLIGQVLGVVTAAGGAGVLTYKKVMADRDASSPDRTKQDLLALQEQQAQDAKASRVVVSLPAAISPTPGA
jgi:hypothetical protein